MLGKCTFDKVCIFNVYKNNVFLRIIKKADYMSKEFRIKKQVCENRTFRIPKDLLERLSVAAASAGVSANEFVVQSIEFALENLVLDEKNKE